VQERGKMECRFDIGDKIRNTLNGECFTIIAIHQMEELRKSSYYTVLSQYLTTQRIKFVTANNKFEKVDHNYDLEDVMQWVRK
jgi:hypothetical protein